MVHSRMDKSIDPSKLDRIYSNLGTADKSRLPVEHSGHVIVREPDRELVFKTTVDFITAGEQAKMTRDLIFMIISLFTWGIGEGMFMYFQPIYLQQWGADPEPSAWFMRVGVAIMVTQIPAGILADRIGARPILRLSWAAWGHRLCVMAAADSLNFLLLGWYSTVLPPLESPP